MSFAYLALEPADEEYNTPCSWPDGWTFPSTSAGPWPPGWPVSAANLAGEDEDDYSISLTVDAWLYAGGPATVTVRTLLNGADTDDFDCQLIKVEADIGGTVVQVKKNADDSFANQVYFRVENYSGANYGFSEPVILDLDSGDDGSTVTITATLCSTEPEYTDDGDLYAAGFFGLLTGGSDDTVEGYMRAANAFITLASYTTTAHVRAGNGSVSGVAYVFGGGNPITRSQINDAYSAAEDSWDTQTPMPMPARHQCIGGAIGASMYACCGDSPSGNTVDTDQYATSTGVWTAKTDAPAPARTAHGSFVVNSKIYLAGGSESVSPAYMDDTDEFDGTNWTSKTSMSQEFDGRPAGFGVGGSGYICGGALIPSPGANPLDEVYAYSQAGDSWSAKTAMRSAKYQLAGFAIGTKGYVVGGQDGASSYYEADEYDTSLDTWTVLQDPVNLPQIGVAV